MRPGARPLLPVVPLAPGRAWSSEEGWEWVLRLSRKSSAQGGDPAYKESWEHWRHRALGNSRSWMGGRGRRWLIMAPSNPNVLTPQAPPPSPKPPGAHVLRLSDRESLAGHLFLPIGKHLVSLNVLCLLHPFFQSLPQRASPNGKKRVPRWTFSWKCWNGRGGEAGNTPCYCRSIRAGLQHLEVGLHLMDFGGPWKWTWLFLITRWSESCPMVFMCHSGIWPRKLVPPTLPLCLPCNDWASRRSSELSEPQIPWS